VCVELQRTEREQTWLKRLVENEVPILANVDTRKLVLHLRDIGTCWGALVRAHDRNSAISAADKIINLTKSQDSDWVYAVSRERAMVESGKNPDGPRVAVLDFGCKANTLREL